MPPGHETITSSPAHQATFGVRKGATRRRSVVGDTLLPSYAMRSKQRERYSIISNLDVNRLADTAQSDGDGAADIVSYSMPAACCVRDDECNHEPATRGQRREGERGTIPNNRQSRVVKLTLFWPPPFHHHLSDHSIDHRADCAVLV
jgi:hypothetical protein